MEGTITRRVFKAAKSSENTGRKNLWKQVFLVFNYL